jgi:hypothetical protein
LILLVELADGLTGCRRGGVTGGFEDVLRKRRDEPAWRRRWKSSTPKG